MCKILLRNSYRKKCKYERDSLTSGHKITLEGLTYRKNQSINQSLSSLSLSFGTTSYWQRASIAPQCLPWWWYCGASLCGIVSEFELQSRYSVHFRANTLGKVWIHLSPLYLWVKYHHHYSTQRIALTLDNPRRLINLLTEAEITSNGRGRVMCPGDVVRG